MASTEAGLELDLIDGVQVGRVGDRQEQTLAALEQRQHAVLGQQLVRHRLTVSRSMVRA
jgi:hypothetical protein